MHFVLCCVLCVQQVDVLRWVHRICKEQSKGVCVCVCVRACMRACVHVCVCTCAVLYGVGCSFRTDDVIFCRGFLTSLFTLYRQCDSGLKLVCGVCVLHVVCVCLACMCTLVLLFVCL